MIQEQDDILTEVERDLVVQFNENKDLVEAVRKVVTMSIYNMGVVKKGKKIPANINLFLRFTPAWNAGLQGAKPEDVGNKVMVMAEALAQLENAFDKLSEYKKVEEGKIKTNIAK
jgi:hypothetical protein